MTDKFYALPPGTPAPIVAAYRDAYRKIMDDPEFNARGLKLSEVFEPMTVDDVNSLGEGHCRYAEGGDGLCEFASP